MSLNRVFCIPNKNTFAMKPVKQLLEKYISLDAIIVDPFANGQRYNSRTITNDIRPGADFTLDAADFAAMLTQPFDAILFDPPYSLEQAKRSYKLTGLHFSQAAAQSVGRWTECKNLLAAKLKVGGLAISFGWSSSGFGPRRGFEIIDILLINHGPGHYDTIITVERKIKEVEWTSGMKPGKSRQKQSSILKAAT